MITVTESPLNGSAITDLCLAAAEAVAVDNMKAAEVYVEVLANSRGGGRALRIAASGWAAIVARHISRDYPGYRFSSTTDAPDEAAEVFGAMVCAVGNGDCAGAATLMVDCDRDVVFEAAMRLLGTAGAALATEQRQAPRRP